MIGTLQTLSGEDAHYIEANNVGTSGETYVSVNLMVLMTVILTVQENLVGFQCHKT